MCASIWQSVWGWANRCGAFALSVVFVTSSRVSGAVPPSSAGVIGNVRCDCTLFKCDRLRKQFNFAATVVRNPCRANRNGRRTAAVNKSIYTSINPAGGCKSNRRKARAARGALWHSEWGTSVSFSLVFIALIRIEMRQQQSPQRDAPRNEVEVPNAFCGTQCSRTELPLKWGDATSNHARHIFIQPPYCTCGTTSSEQPKKKNANHQRRISPISNQQAVTDLTETAARPQRQQQHLKCIVTRRTCEILSTQAMPSHSRQGEPDARRPSIAIEGKYNY